MPSGVTLTAAQKRDRASVRVICAGLPRTGTSSLVEALTRIGCGPVYHMAQQMHDSWRNDPMRRAADASFASMDTIDGIPFTEFFAGFKSVTNVPCCELLPQFLHAYPGAVVVLTRRSSGEVWWESILGSMWPMCNPDDWSLYYTTWLFPPLRSFVPMCKSICRHWRWKWATLGPDIHDKHNDWVRELVPKDKLLEFDPKDGYKPLCDFLGVPVPKNADGRVEQYPHVNDRATMQRMTLGIQAVGVACWVLLAAATAGSAIAMQRYYPTIRIWLHDGP